MGPGVPMRGKLKDELQEQWMIWFYLFCVVYQLGFLSTQGWFGVTKDQDEVTCM